MKWGIYGAGQGGAMALRWLPSDQEVICFIDSNKEKQGKVLKMLPILSLSDAIELGTEAIIIAVLRQEAVHEIQDTILQFGFQGEIHDINVIRKVQDIRAAAIRMASEQIRIRNVQGAVAELGVYRGDTARELNRLFPDRNLYLFDTFKGFHEKDIEQETKLTGVHTFADFSDTGIDYVRKRLPYPDKATFVEGYFPESLKVMKKEARNFAMVSLDTDLYAPTKAGLEYFWPRLSPGGCILIHDYTSLQYPGVRIAVDGYCEEHGLFLVPLMDLHGTALLIRQG